MELCVLFGLLGSSKDEFKPEGKPFLARTGPSERTGQL